MTLTGESPKAANIVQRATNIILRPSAEWDVIDHEPATVQGLFTGYAMILAAIGPICSTVGMLVFGVGIPGLAVYRPSPVGLIVSAIVSYLLSLAMVFVLGLVIDALAPSFDGTKDRLKAMKVAVYGSTASWLAGVFGLIPMLGILGLLGLYSLFLVYRGLPRLMKAPQDKALGYTAVVIVLMIVFAIVASLIVAPLHMLGMATGGLSTTTTSITTTN